MPLISRGNDRQLGLSETVTLSLRTSRRRGEADLVDVHFTTPMPTTPQFLCVFFFVFLGRLNLSK